MLAFHGSQELKDKYLDRVRRHRAADELVKGTGWNGHRGCAIGCTLEAYDHEQYERELGVPVRLARLQDQIFERLPEPSHLDWPEQFLASITPGADLSHVWHHFEAWKLSEVAGLLHISHENREAIAAVRMLHEQCTPLGNSAWSAAQSAAVSAAVSAALSAWSARIASEGAARSAARSAVSAALSAALSAESAAESAGSAAESAAWEKMARKLLELLADAPLAPVVL